MSVHEVWQSLPHGRAEERLTKFFEERGYKCIDTAYHHYTVAMIIMLSAVAMLLLVLHTELKPTLWCSGMGMDSQQN